MAVHRAAAHPTLRQFLRFASVGAVGTAAHYGVLFALLELADMGRVLATSLGFLCGAVVTYTLNRRVTFVTSQPVGITFVKYLAAVGVGFALNAAIVALLHDVTMLIAQPVATGVVLFWNFGASRFLVFRERPREEVVGETFD
jgi:putative flippase GtrA